MESRQSKRGAMEEDDRLSSLPDDLLHSILRGIPLRHAARTSTLSRRWAPVWLRALACSPVVDFTDRDFVRGQTPARAAATVDRCLRFHAEHGTPLDAFRVALDGAPIGGGAGALGRDVVVGWVVDAVARGARDVEVDLTPARGNWSHQLDADQGSAALLEIPGDLFRMENSLARLSLDWFSLRAVPPEAPGFAGLRSLSLSRADVTGAAVQAAVTNCRFLESLSLRSCHILKSVRIAGENLRRLELVGCLAVRELIVTAPVLESFAFHGDIVYSSDDEYVVEAAVDLGATPALRDAYLSHLGFDSKDDVAGKEFAYSDFLSRVAHARTLTLCSIGLQHMWELLGFDYDLKIDMTNVQEMQLLMASLGNEDLQAVSCFFQFVELPLLDRLFVQLSRELSLDDIESGAAEELAGEVDNAGIIIYEDDFVLGHLRLIKVVNFRGTRLELMMLAFLVKRAPVLEQLVLVTVDEGEAPGNEQLKMIQERVSAMRKASLEARVTVCRPTEDRSSQNPAHTRFYHEECMA